MALFLQPRDPAVLRLFRHPDDGIGRACRRSCRRRSTRLRRSAGARDVGGHRVSARQHGGHPRRRLSRRAHRAPRPRRGRGAARRRGAARDGGDWPRVSRPLVVPLFAVIGFVLGATGPSRDLIVRNATPKGAAGRVYGFVYSGLDLGATLGPVWFGLMLDHGSGREMFYVDRRSPRARGRHRRARAARDAFARPSQMRKSDGLGIAGRARAGVRREQGTGTRLRGGARATKACE